ncbi:MAG TPA: Hsp20/alpha crystallin family protein [Aggregatilineales bacterium]|nr:Hsp20/alpha crystallin family protein [Aggregatilineales bacterium]
MNLRDQVNKVFEDTFQSGTSLPVDIHATNDSVLVVTGALLNLDTSSLDISITDGSELTISGETLAPDVIPESQFLQKERKFGTFSRTVSIPVSVIAEDAKASYKNCVLTITIPRAEGTGPKVVKVKPVE